MAIKRCSADAAFSDALRLSRNHTCECCERQGRTECAHIYGRRHKSIRWCVMNALSLCHTCHRYFTENPLDFEAWLKERVGEAYLAILKEKRTRLQKDSAPYRKEVAKHYRQQIKLLEAGNHQLVSFQ